MISSLHPFNSINISTPYGIPNNDLSGSHKTNKNSHKSTVYDDSNESRYMKPMDIMKSPNFEIASGSLTSESKFKLPRVTLTNFEKRG